MPKIGFFGKDLYTISNSPLMRTRTISKERHAQEHPDTTTHDTLEGYNATPLLWLYQTDVRVSRI